MGLPFYNLAAMTVASTGTGTITLGSAATINGVLYLSFASAGVPDGQQVYYSINDVGGSEVGLGTYSASGTTLTRGPIASTNSNAAINMTAAAIVKISPPASQFREVLTADRTVYVGANLGAVTLSIASPCVAGLTAHGLQANDPVVFQVPVNRRSCTISAANPGVVTLTNTFAAGQPVSFDSTGTLPAGLAQGTTYYVISGGLSGSSFEVSATVGGAAINTTALTNTFVNGNTTVTTSAAHNLVVGQIIQFAGTSVINVSNATNYYVLTTPLATTFTFSATNGGSAITPGAVTTQGTFVQCGSHFCSTVGSLPTGVTAGTTYFVISAGLTANAFEFSATQGGSAINTSGSVTGSPIYTVRTGNNNNPGTSATRAGALLTAQAGLNTITAVDLFAHSYTVQLADGFYPESPTFPPYIGRGTQGHITPSITGNASIPSNVVIQPLSGNAFVGVETGGFEWLISNLRINASGANCITSDAGSWICVNNVEFGPATLQMQAENGGLIEIVGNYSIVASAALHTYITGGGSRILYNANAVTLVSVPTFSVFTQTDAGGFELSISLTFSGSATGTRFVASTGGCMNTNGAGANYFPGNAAGSSATGYYI